MNTLIKITKNMSLIMALAILLSFANTSASEIKEPLKGEDDSTYRYHALENKMTIFDLINNINHKEEERSIIVSQPAYDTDTGWQQIVKKQNFSLEQIENSMNTLQNTNEIKTFLVGSNLNILKFQLIQIREYTLALNALAQKTENDSLKTQINDKINLLQTEQIRVENFIIEQERKFKLFGWFVAML